MKNIFPGFDFFIRTMKLAFYCSLAVLISTGSAMAQPVTIGQTFGGGILFYVDEAGHGLVAAPADQTAGSEWGCTFTPISGTSTALGTGQLNTTAIVNGCSAVNIAAFACDNLSLSGFTDWYLPGKEELNIMWNAIGQAAKGSNQNIGGFANDFYWSSSEETDSSAWSQDLNSGFQYQDCKSNLARVRAIRSVNITCVVSIPDNNFKNELLANSAININGDGFIQCTEAAAFSGTISVNVKAILDLTGIEAFTALTGLHCSGNSITSLNLSSNLALKDLDCSDNIISSLTLPGGTELNGINCSFNSINKLDLSGYTAMNKMLCSHNHLTRLNVKNGHNASVTNANFDIRSNSGLTCVEVDNTFFSDINWLQKDATASYSVSCFGCIVHIPDTVFKKTLVNDPTINTNGDEEIQCSEASAFTGDIAYFGDFQSTGENIFDLTGIEAFTSLTKLHINNCYLTSLDLSQNTSLTIMDLFQNHLLNVDVSHNTALTELYLDNNLLRTIDLSQNILLTSFASRENPLIGLDVSNNTALIELNLEYSLITGIDISHNTLLTTARIHDNPLLTSLDCSHNLLLESAEIYQNPLLTSIDFSHNPNLLNVDLDHCDLESVNIKSGHSLNLSFADFTGNPRLLCIQVDDSLAAATNPDWTKDETASYSTNCIACVVNWYRDADGDGFGDAGIVRASCLQPSGFVSDNTDCNDGNPNIKPTATELCNGIDDNCNSQIDEGLNLGNACSVGVGACRRTGVIVCDGHGGTMCDVVPGTPSIEICNGIDDDCDGVIDEGVPAPVPGTISGLAKQCLHSGDGTTVFSLLPVAVATAYHWTVPTGLTIINGQGTTSITVKWTNKTLHNGIRGPLCVTASNSCGNGQSCLPIEMYDTKPSPPASISGLSKLCPGDTTFFSVAPVVRATSFTWTVPGDMNIISGQGDKRIKVAVLSGFVDGHLSVTADNVCGSSGARHKDIHKDKPDAPGPIAGPVNGVCNQKGMVYSIAPVGNAKKYLWEVSSAGIIVGSDSGLSVEVNWGSFVNATVSVMSINGCGSSSARKLKVKAAPDKPEVIFGNQLVCTSMSYHYFVDPVFGADVYTWRIPAHASIIGQGTTDVDITFGSKKQNDRVIDVSASNDCGTSSRENLKGIDIIDCIRSLESELREEISIYPNPAHDRITIKFKSNESANYLIQLKDASNRVVLQQNKTIGAGIVNLDLDISKIAKGIYFIAIQHKDRILHSKILVE